MSGSAVIEEKPISCDACKKADLHDAPMDFKPYNA
jgi:hypothetical protein